MNWKHAEVAHVMETTIHKTEAAIPKQMTIGWYQIINNGVAAGKQKRGPEYEVYRHVSRPNIGIPTRYNMLQYGLDKPLTTGANLRHHSHQSES